MSIVAQIIPIQAVPSQTINVALNDQACQINIYGKNLFVPQTPPGSIATDPPLYEPEQDVFIDLYVNDTLVIGGCLARNAVGVVQNTYFGFVGEIAIEDTQPSQLTGPSDPFIAGLGSRFLLTYWYDAP